MQCKMTSLVTTIEVEVISTSIDIPTDINEALKKFEEIRDMYNENDKKGYVTCVSLLNWAITCNATLSNVRYYDDAYSFEFSFEKYSCFRIFGDSLEFNVKGIIMSTC